MGDKLYNGISMQMCGDGRVLVNAGNNWQVAKYTDVERDFDAILKDSQLKNEFLLWYDYGIGGES